MKEARTFHRSVKDTEKAQKEILETILGKHQYTVYGQQHSFANLSSPRDFQGSRAPKHLRRLREPFIQSRIAEGEQNVLTGERVRLLEPTSGSTSASKLIPYTSSLQKAFMRGIAPWIADLFRHYPSLLTGAAYWSISPVLQTNKYSPGGIPIGFEEDSAYLGTFGAWLSKAIMAAPGDIRFIKNSESFRYATLFFLLQREDLRLISVWNPTFLTLLLKPLEAWGDQLATDVEKGQLSVDIEKDLKARLERHAGPSPRRAAVIRQALQTDDVTQHLWPHLRLISCWTDANAAPFAKDLQTLFPHVTFQGKGLLSTEAFVSLPLTKTEAPCPRHPFTLF